MLTLLSCGQPQNGSLVKALIEAFKARVLADGGVFSAESCLVSTLNSLNV